MPTDLDLALRTPGQALLLRRDNAQGLLDRALTEAPRRGGGLMSGIARILGKEESGPGEPVFASPQIAWAGDVEFGEGYTIIDGIAVIDIRGVLTPEGYFDWWDWAWVGGYVQFAAAIEAAEADERVTAKFLRVDSPGGLVDGCFDCAEDMARHTARAGGKPLWVHAKMACSAAYALASVADRIVATREAIVGSIGVLILHTEVAKWLAEAGINVEAIESYPNKTDGGWWKALSDEARADLKSVVDQIARRFVGIVGAGRPLDADAIAALSARWFLAEHDEDERSGLSIGLVDELGTERAAFEALKDSLSTTTGDGATAGAGNKGASGSARAASTQEHDMNLRAEIAALRKKAAAGDAKALEDLKAMGVSLKAMEDAPEKEDEPEGEGGDDNADDDPEGEGEDEGADDEAEGEDDDEEPAASAKGPKAGFALGRSPLASGREKLASRLGEKVAAGKLTYGEAKAMLKDSPKGSRLAAAMANRDRNPGADTGDTGVTDNTWKRSAERVNRQMGVSARKNKGAAA